MDKAPVYGTGDFEFESQCGLDARVAQWIRRLTSNQKIAGSIPAVGF